MFFPRIACILASEGLKKQVCDGKCSQWPHLCTTFEATYDLKLTDNEIFAKNRSTKKCNFLRIFAEVQWSITQSLLQ